MSVTLVYCVQKAQDIVKLLSQTGSPIILVFFRIYAPMSNSKLKPVILGANYTGWEIVRLSTEIAVYLGNGAR